jgi:hypothetical protein
VNTFRWLPVVLLVGLPAGCGPNALPTLPKDSKGRPVVAIEPKDTKPSEKSEKPATLESLVQEAPTVPLTKLALTFNKAALTLETPSGATPDIRDDRVRVLSGDVGLMIRPWAVELRSPEWLKQLWGGEKGPKVRRAVLDTPDTLVVETDRADDARYFFVTKVSAGPLDLGLTFAKPSGVTPVLGTRADVLLWLKCARTLALKDPLPSDPAEALEKLGVLLKREGKTVTSANLHDTAATRSTLELLAKLTTVKDADLGWLKAEGADLAPLAALKNLESVTFANTPVRDEGLKTVGQLTNLHYLDLEHTDITAAGLPSLSGLKQLRKLKLDLNDLSGSGASSLSSLAGLEELSLYAAKVGDAGLKAVAPLKKLKVLNLEECPVTGAGLAPLADLVDLEELALNHTSVDDAGLVFLEKLKHLRKLNLKKTKVTAEGVRKLKKALPETNIKSDV